MSALVTDKGFYKSLLMITIPIAFQNLIGLGMNLVDTMMLGSLGEKQISASALANQPYFVFTLFIFGLCSGACVLTAQYWGKGDTEAISRILMMAVKISVVSAIIFSSVVLIFPEIVMSFYTNDKEVISLGSQFLRIIGFSYIISSVSITYLYILRSVENVRLPLLINISCFAVNAILNWIFIYGKLGFSAMGIRGSATATLCARILELSMALVYSYAFDKKLRFRLRDIFRSDRFFLHDFIFYSAPVVINETLWSLGITFQSVIIGHIGSKQVAAYSIAGIVQRLASVVIFGVANSAALMVGKQIGANDEIKAKAYAKTILFLSVILGIVATCVILLLREPAVNFYNVSEETKEFARQLITVYAINITFIAFNCVNIVGILRSGGDTRFAMALDVTTLWLVALPFGALAGLYFHLPLPVVFFILTIDESVKFFIGIFRFRSGKWLRNVTK